MGAHLCPACSYSISHATCRMPHAAPTSGFMSFTMSIADSTSPRCTACLTCMRSVHMRDEREEELMECDFGVVHHTLAMCKYTPIRPVSESYVHSPQSTPTFQTAEVHPCRCAGLSFKHAGCLDIALRSEEEVEDLPGSAPCAADDTEVTTLTHPATPTGAGLPNPHKERKQESCFRIPR